MMMRKRVVVALVFFTLLYGVLSSPSYSQCGSPQYVIMYRLYRFLSSGVVSAQEPIPCEVSGWVTYNTGGSADNQTTCTIYDEGWVQLGTAVCNNSGWYIKTVTVDDLYDQVNVNCTEAGTGYTGGNNWPNCTHQPWGEELSVVEINVTLIISEYPGGSGRADTGFFTIMPMLFVVGLGMLFVRRTE